MHLKSLEDYERYFESTLKPRLAEIEAARQRVRPRIWRYMRWWLLLFVAAVTTAMTVSATSPEHLPYVGWMPGLTIVMALIVVPLWRGIQYAIRAGKLAKRVKQEVILDAIGFLAPELAYDKAGSMDEQLVRASGLFHHWLGVEGEDRFSGRVGETEILFCELKFEYRGAQRGRRSSSSRSGSDHHKTSGLFLVADFNKHFSGRTLLYPDFEIDHVLLDAAKGLMEAVQASAKALGLETEREQRGGLYYLGTPPGMELVRMEDPAFERVYKVYATDPVEATYILSTSLMQRLTAFREKAGHGLMISFVGSRLYLFLPLVGQDLFDVQITDDMDEWDTFRAFHDQLALALGVVEDLGLNTRVWSKGAGDDAGAPPT